MIYEGQLIGKFVSLRSIMIEDSEDTLRMRLNTEKTRFLHPVQNDLQKQKQWIESSRKKPDEYHFTAINKSGKIIGNVGIYEIKNDIAHIGRVLSFGNALESFEIYYLAIVFAFETLQLDNLWGDTDIENKSAISFSKFFGFEYGEKKWDNDLKRYVCYCDLTRTSFEENKKNIERMMYRR